MHDIVCPKAQTFYHPNHYYCKPEPRDHMPHAGLYWCYDQLFQWRCAMPIGN